MGQFLKVNPKRRAVSANLVLYARDARSEYGMPNEEERIKLKVNIVLYSPCPWIYLNQSATLRRQEVGEVRSGEIKSKTVIRNSSSTSSIRYLSNAKVE